MRSMVEDAVNPCQWGNTVSWRGSVKYSVNDIGSALLISLILLLVITVSGLTAVKMATLEQKMTGNYQDQQMAFYAAEAALKEAENIISENRFDLSLFNFDCDNGYCFSGSDVEDIGSCHPGVSEPWLDESVWIDSKRHRTTEIPISGILTKAKYIIEFLCYIAIEGNGPDPDPANHREWAHLYRISVIASGGSSDSRVMLQTLYKKNS